MDQLISFSKYSVGIFNIHFNNEKNQNSESETSPMVMQLIKNRYGSQTMVFLTLNQLLFLLESNNKARIKREV